jgi:hypothetical protein
MRQRIRSYYWYYKEYEMTRTYNTLRVGSEIVTEISGEQPDVVGYLLFIIPSFFQYLLYLLILCPC